jgi:hypothetical protein
MNAAAKTTIAHTIRIELTDPNSAVTVVNVEVAWGGGVVLLDVITVDRLVEY